MWRERITAGWRPNQRISTLGYYESAAYYGVYIWEYLHVISPLLRQSKEDGTLVDRNDDGR
jgi:hypothetical protein